MPLCCIGLCLWIEVRLEGREAKAAVGLQEGFFRTFAQPQIAFHQAFDGGHNLVLGKPRTSALTNFCVPGGVTAKRDLVVLHASAVETKDTDVAHVVVPARVDAA